MKTDKIFIEGAVFACKVGITAMERRKKQKIVCTIELTFDVQAAAVSDAIHDTINYSEVLRAVRNLIEHKEYSLIETMAEEITTIILTQFPTPCVHLILRKPGALKKYGASSAGIEITRQK